MGVADTFSAGGSQFVTVQGSNIWGGQTRGLLLFDLSSLPEDGAIIAAAINVRITVQGSNAPMSFHRLLEDWDEGIAGQGSTDSSLNALRGYPLELNVSQASFNFRKQTTILNNGTFAAISQTAWATPGGSASATIRNTQRDGSVPNLSILAPFLVEDLQDWRSGQLANHGWLLRTASGASNAFQFYSRESPYPPVLQVIMETCPSTTPQP